MSASSTAITSSQTSAAIISSKEPALSSMMMNLRAQAQSSSTVSVVSSSSSSSQSFLETSSSVSGTISSSFAMSYTARKQLQVGPPLSPVLRSCRVTICSARPIGSFESPSTHEPIKAAVLKSSHSSAFSLPPAALSQRSSSALSSQSSSSIVSSSGAVASSSATAEEQQVISIENSVWGHVIDIWAKYYQVNLQLYNSYEEACAFLHTNLDTQTLTMPHSSAVSKVFFQQKYISQNSNIQFIIASFAGRTLTINELCHRIIKTTKALVKRCKVAAINAEALASGLATGLTEAALKNP